jgi:hypothetical protein
MNLQPKTLSRVFKRLILNGYYYFRLPPVVQKINEREAVSSGDSQRTESQPTDPEARVRFPALPDFLEKEKGNQVVGLERGPLGLVSTTEELLDKKIATPV